MDLSNHFHDIYFGKYRCISILGRHIDSREQNTIIIQYGIMYVEFYLSCVSPFDNLDELIL